MAKEKHQAAIDWLRQCIGALDAYSDALDNSESPHAVKDDEAYKLELQAIALRHAIRILRRDTT